MIEQAGALEMMLRDPADGRCRDRHRQLARRKLADQLRRAGFHRDAGVEAPLHLGLAILKQPRDREIGAEPLLQDEVDFRLGGSDHRMAEIVRKIVAHGQRARDHRAAIDALGVEQQAVHVEDHGLDGKGKAVMGGSGDLHRWAGVGAYRRATCLIMASKNA